jgi:hypothetical protein
MESRSSFDAYRMPDAMRQKTVCLCLITRPVRLEADHGEIYDPSRTQFSTDYVEVANGKRFPKILLQAVRHTPISRNTTLRDALIRSRGIHLGVKEHLCVDKG